MVRTPSVRQRVKLFRCAAATVATLAVGRTAQAQFYMGSDISLLSFFQQQGATYKSAAGQTLPADQVLYNAGDNLFRLRIFVNPNTSYSATEGAIQNLSYDLALAQQLKTNDPGAKLLLDFHYSDTWADPGHQTTPTEWGGSSASLSSLETNLYNYTYNTLESFQAAGVMPAIVQLGNEINSGMDWNTGELNFGGGTAENQSWANLGALLNQGIAAVRAAQGTGPKIQIAIHVANGASSDEPQFFFNDLQTLGGVTGYDIEGVSFYPGNGNGATLSLLQSNLTTLANSYPTKKIMVLETNYPYENFTSNTYTGYADTTAGQALELSQVASVIQNLPHNTGEGVVYWDAEGIQVPGVTVYNGGATALFSSTGAAEPAVADFGITMASESWASTTGGSWDGGQNWSNGVVPQQAGDAVTFGSGGPAGPVTLDANLTVGAITFNNTNSYTLSTGVSGTLVMDNTSPTLTATMTNTLGSHAITAPIVLNSNLSIAVTNAPSTLTLQGGITENPAHPGRSITLTGAGTAVLSVVNVSGPLTVGTAATASFLQLASGSGASTVGPVTVNAGSTLDLTNNVLVIKYASPGADPIASIQAAVTSGAAFNGSQSTWTGTGITSSLAASSNGKYSIGYLDGDLASDNTTNNPIAPNQIILKYTLTGDAFLENTVGFDDLLVVAQNYGAASGMDWAQGSFDYTGSVGFGDLLSVAQNYGGNSGISEGSTASNAGILSLAWPQSVPEPSSAALALAASLTLLRRRRAAQKKSE